MNKKLLIFAAATSALCFAFGLAACGNNETAGNGENGGHVHTADGFSSDADVHWKICTDCGETFSEGDHVYNGSNTCTECGYTIPETAGLEYELDEETDSYFVTGIGTAENESKIYIPAYHEDKRVSTLSSAFYECNFEELHIPSTVENIECSISACNSLTELKVPDSVTTFWGGAGNTKLKSVTFGENSKLEKVGKGSFGYCLELTSVNLPDTVKLIENETFEGSKLYTDKSYWVDGVLYVGNHLIAVDETVSGKLVLREGTKTIAEASFPYDGITEIVMPESLVAIHDFAGEAVKNISFPKNLEIIGGNTFNETENLDHITVASGNPFFNDGNGSDCLIETETGLLLLGSNNGKIPEGVKEIDWGAFTSCHSLKSIVIPASCTAIPDGAFYFCDALESIAVADGNAVYHSEGNCLIETESKTLVLGCKTSTIPTGGSVTAIGSRAFQSCTLETITIPSTIKSIATQAFSNCKQLRTVEIPEGVTEVGGAAFEWCEALTTIKIPSSVLTLGAHIFDSCKALSTIEYSGTTDAWMAMARWWFLGYDCGEYSIVCSNGTLPMNWKEL